MNPFRKAPPVGTDTLAAEAAAARQIIERHEQREHAKFGRWLTELAARQSQELTAELVRNNGGRRSVDPADGPAPATPGEGLA